VARTAGGLALLAMALLLGLGGLGLLTWALYQVLAPLWGPAAAAAALGAGMIVIAGGLLWQTRRLTR